MVKILLGFYIFVYVGFPQSFSLALFFGFLVTSVGLSSVIVLFLHIIQASVNKTVY